MHCILIVSSSLELFSFSGAKPCHAACSQSRLYHFPPKALYDASNEIVGLKIWSIVDH